MTFVVEDGTGLATATSLCSVSDATAYWTDRGDKVDWLSQVVADQQAALIRASDYVRNQRRYRWFGTKKSYVQRMPWPRVGGQETDGLAVPESTVPWQVAEAVAYLAGKGLSGELQSDLARGGQITSERLDVISVTYADSAPPGTAYQFVDGILAPLLRSLTLPLAIPTYVEPDIADGFTDNQFINNS